MCDPPSRRGTAAVMRACAAVDRYDALTARSGVDARGPIRLQPGDLILMDEASVVATPDLADVITQAAAAGAKVTLAGDTQQLQAVHSSASPEPRGWRAAAASCR